MGSNVNKAAVWSTLLQNLLVGIRPETKVGFGNNTGDLMRLSQNPGCVGIMNAKHQ